VAEDIVLSVKDLYFHYGDFRALADVSLEVERGQIVSIIGSNGAGKSTLLNTICGLLHPTSGTIELFGKRIDGLRPYQTVKEGLALVPEGRRVFPGLTVYENLFMGTYTPRLRPRKDALIEKLYDLFPILKQRDDQMAETLSGGEQQMLAIARAMMTDPKVLLCDEISLGLAPVVIKDIYKRLAQINSEGMTIVLVEQDIKRSLKTAQKAYIMLEGKVVLEGPPESFSEDKVKQAYFGI